MASLRPCPVYEDGIHDVEIPSFRRMSDGGNVFSSRVGPSPVPQMASNYSEKHHANFGDNIREQKLPHVNERGHSPYGLGNLAPSHRQYPVQDIGNGSSSYNPSTHDAQNAYLQNLISELRKANNSKSQLITDLQVKVAVLENELKHVTLAKDSVHNSLGFMVQAFSQASSMNQLSSGTLRLQDRATRDAAEAEIKDRKDMEREIEDLRKTNRRLKREAQENQEVQVRARLKSPMKLEGSREKFHARDAASQPKDISFELPGKGKKVEFRLDTGRRTFLTVNPNDPPPSTRPSRIPAWNETSSENSPLEKPVGFSLQPNGSFESNSTTVLNTPISPTRKLGEVQDEFVTIDELCYDSDDSKCRAKKIERDVYFRKMPPPGVLKTGIKVPGKYMGNETEFVLSGKTHWNKWSGVRPQEHLHNPYAPPTLQKLTSGLSDSPLNCENGAWSSREERDIALDLHQRDCQYSNDRRCPDFFKHGIQFTPAEQETNSFRTVIISNLPKDITLRDVVARVRGGELFSSFLCNTYPITRSMTVRVVFKHEKSASDYIEFCSEHPLAFSSESEPTPRTAIITRVDTPTYPSNHTRINEQSRCLCIKNVPTHLYPYDLHQQIACKNAFRAESLLEFFLDKDRSLHMQFASIDAAGSTLGFFNNRRAYRDLGLVATFWDDPCVGSVDELLVDEGDARKWSKPTFVFGSKKYGSDEPGGEISGPLRLAAAEHQHNSEEIKNNGQQRKQLISLTKQKVDIPTLNGKNIGGPSWADEVIEEQEPPFVKPDQIPIPRPSPQQSDKEDTSFSSDSTISFLDINRLMTDPTHKIWEQRKPPLGLAASKYATLIPSFEPFSRDHIPPPPTAGKITHPVDHHRAHIVLDYGEDIERPKFGFRAEKAEGDGAESEEPSSSDDSACINLSKKSVGKKHVDIDDAVDAEIKRVDLPPPEKSVVERNAASPSSPLPDPLASSSYAPFSPSPQRVLTVANPDEIQLFSSSSAFPLPHQSSSASPAPAPALFTPQPILVVTNPDEIQLDSDSDSDSDSELEEGEIKEESD